MEWRSFKVLVMVVVAWWALAIAAASCGQASSPTTRAPSEASPSPKL